MRSMNWIAVWEPLDSAAGGSDQPRGSGTCPELDLRQPVPICRTVAPRHTEVEVVDPLHQGARLAVAHRNAVDRADRHDLPAAAAEEGLVTDIELRAVDVTLLDGKVELSREELDERLTGDAFQDVIRDRRRDHYPLLDREQARPASLGHLATGVQEDGRVIAVLPRLDATETGVEVVASALGPERRGLVGHP